MMFPRALLVVALAGAAAGSLGCGSPSGRDRFARDVVPVLERRCLSAACHGVAPGAEAAGEVVDRAFFFVDVDAAGRVVDPDAAYDNVKARINTVEASLFSSLVRKPLAIAAGGVPHAGGHPFSTRDHDDVRAIVAWIDVESGGGEGAAIDSLDPLRRRFADEVLPVLRDRGCMLARCHGPLGFAGTVFDPPMDGQSGAFSTAQVTANYQAARRNLALGGDPARSRLLVKALPLDGGGIVHRGGNDGFFPRTSVREPIDDPGAQAILAWARAEREAAVGGAAGGQAEPSGLVFVRGPAAPRALLDLDVFRPGSDVWLLPSFAPGAQAVNLTAGAHPDGPADVRDPAVSHDGTRVVFSMRTSEAAGHDLWEIGLDGQGARQLTVDGTASAAGGPRVTNRWPVYGPGDVVTFASNRAGEVDESGRAADLELYELRGGEVVRLTWTPTPELAPSFLASGEFRGSVAFTVIRRLGGRFEGPVFRFPPDRSAEHAQPEYHPHHGQTAPGDVTWTLRELPDGRDVAVVIDEGNVWEAGGLAVIERQLGPDLDASQAASPSVPGFRHAVSVVDRVDLWRDPAPLPDGRIAVAWAPGTIDPTDPSTPIDTGIYVAAIESGPDGMARLASLDLLVDESGLADDQPAIVYVRPEEDEAHARAWDPAAETGFLKHSGVTTVEAVLRRLAPSGAKPLRTDAVAVRLVEWIPPPAGETPAVDPGLIANGDPASTWWSNGVHGPSRVLAEPALAEDGTLYAELPANRPFRIHLVDGDGLAAGTQGARWLYVAGGEVHPQGVAPSRYGRLCAGCHGSLDGDPGEAMPPLDELDLDAISGASITMSTHRGRDPRRPLAPVAIPAATGGFHFGRDLAPVFERSCAGGGCHAGDAPAGGLRLEAIETTYYDLAYEALQTFGEGSTGGKRWIDERGASAWGSFLMEKITGRELGAPREVGSACPPEGSGVAPLTEEEIRAIARWIDLGAIYRTPGETP